MQSKNEEHAESCDVQSQLLLLSASEQAAQDFLVLCSSINSLLISKHLLGKKYIKKKEQEKGEERSER